MSKATDIYQSLLNALTWEGSEKPHEILWPGILDKEAGEIVFKSKGKVKRFRILVEEVKPGPEYFAVAFGNDGFTGDSSFACDYAIPATKKSTFKELLKTWTKAQKEDGELENCFGDDRPVGFWVLSKKSLGIVKSMVREVHNDSDAYMQNSTGKHLVHKLATRVVGDVAVLKS